LSRKGEETPHVYRHPPKKKKKKKKKYGPSLFVVVP